MNSNSIQLTRVSLFPLLWGIVSVHFFSNRIEEIDVTERKKTKRHQFSVGLYTLTSTLLWELKPVPPLSN